MVAWMQDAWKASMNLQVLLSRCLQAANGLKPFIHENVVQDSTKFMDIVCEGLRSVGIRIKQVAYGIAKIKSWTFMPLLLWKWFHHICFISLHGRNGAARTRDALLCLIILGILISPCKLRRCLPITMVTSHLPLQKQLHWSSLRQAVQVTRQNDMRQDTCFRLVLLSQLLNLSQHAHDLKEPNVPGIGMIEQMRVRYNQKTP
mmetsp:Transcript_34880/g.43044  ORF Transcript_34880/g.43044 Transcript_34880/m.43044 type:complete len:203 (-) Transcript_34880:450-1058(-)